jgi:Formate-dependent phosphoribosylglycinamide formyltransferase (GAR transformylase)
MITQTLSEFEVHARAILKLPIPEVKLLVSGACHAIDAVTLAENEKGYYPIFNGIEEFLKIPGTDIRIYGKPFAYPNRRLAVLLAYGKDIEEAKEKVRYGAKIIEERVSYVYKY